MGDNFILLHELFLRHLLLVDHDGVLVDCHREVVYQFVQIRDLLALCLLGSLLESLALGELGARSYELAS